MLSAWSKVVNALSQSKEMTSIHCQLLVQIFKKFIVSERLVTHAL